MEDLQLWKSFLKGDRSTFEMLFTRHYKGLYQYGCKLQADHQLIDDCIQDLFFELWTNRENLPQVESVKGYLFRSLRYKLHRQLKRAARHSSLLGEDYNHWETSYESFLIDEEKHQAIQQKLTHFVEQLSPRQREALTLRFTNQLSYEEISDVMDISYQAVVNLVYKSLKYLRENLVSLPEFVMVVAFSWWLTK